MNDNELISALMDGELEGPDRDRAVSLLMHQPALAETWRRWQLVRSSLKHEASDTLDLSARVAAQLATEPVLLVPAAVQRPRQARLRMAWAGALAASLALGVGIWVWSSLETAPSAEIAALYNAAPQVTVVSESAAAAGVARPATTSSAKALDDDQRENAYIVAHAEYAHRGLQTGLRNFARVAVADDNADDLAGEAL